MLSGSTAGSITPPSVGEHPGARTVSAIWNGIHMPTVTPGCTTTPSLHAHTVADAAPEGTPLLDPAIVTPPSLIGKMQSQQMSVIRRPVSTDPSAQSGRLPAQLRSESPATKSAPTARPPAISRIQLGSIPPLLRRATPPARPQARSPGCATALPPVPPARERHAHPSAPPVAPAARKAAVRWH